MEAKKPRKITPEEVEEIRRRFSEQMDQMVQNLNRGALESAENEGNTGDASHPDVSSTPPE